VNSRIDTVLSSELVLPRSLYPHLPNLELTHDAEEIAVVGDIASPAPIPEPSTMLLMGTGLAVLAGWRYRKGV